MKICSLYGGAFLGLWVFSFFAVSFCHGNDKIVLEVVGIGECTDCADSNIQASQAFSGLHVTIDCKDTNGELKTRGVGKLDDEGKFRVSLPSNILEKYGNLKEECFAQLHSASAAPCPAHSGSSESSKIVFKSKTARKHTFSPAGILKFCPATCTSAFLWHFFMHPPLPKHPPLMNFSHPFHFHPKFFHPIHNPLSPPVPVYVKPLPPPIPIYKEPLPPHVPFFEPKPPLFEPHVPIYKPPVVEPPVIYVKPLPPPVPIYNPKPPVFEHPPIFGNPFPHHVPIYKPKPPVFEHPPIYGKPLPPHVPAYNPKPPMFVIEHPPLHRNTFLPLVPIFKPKPPMFEHPPIFTKPLPPAVPIYKPKPPLVEPPSIPKVFPPIFKHLHPFPKIHKIPCPLFPKLPPIPNLAPPVHFPHPMFGAMPPLPPHFPHP